MHSMLFMIASYSSLLEVAAAALPLILCDALHIISAAVFFSQEGNRKKGSNNLQYHVVADKEQINIA